MLLNPNLEIIDLALWLKKEQILIISDLHLGYEEYLQQKGVFLPKFQLAEIVKSLKSIFKKVKPATIVINGDLKHEFGRVLKQEWKEVLQLIDFLLQNCRKLILIKGNHDLILGPIASKKNVEIVNEHQINDILIIHGDKLVQKTTAKTLIIGHEHPAITLKEKGKIEKYKCFLLGKWKNKSLIVLPSFNPLLEGTDIVKERLLSPFLSNISNFRVVVVGKEEAFDFGKHISLLAAVGAY
ncbi:MAG TPA: metallophosphoesterase [Candidatus Nanoarchaeia archaeon]|nr:metallophosphoesterase [Candidatus Nanoarchaeia archaeon]